MLYPAKLLLAILALTLAGCAASMETPDGSAGVTVFGGAVNYHVGGAPGCGGAIAEFRALIDRDRSTGNLSPSVHRRAAADLEGVKAACAAGRSAEANSRLAAVKSRYGYR
jgi:hypothetical protein